MKQNNKFIVYTLATIVVLFSITNSCKKKDVNDDNDIEIPTVTTSSASNITKTTANCGGNVTSQGGAPVTARGVCWSTSENPTVANSKTSDGTGTGNFTSSIAGMNPSAIYYVRAYATNSGGTGYGNSVICQTQPGVIDVDGNVYDIVTIGSQIWMAENLKVTHFQNGNPITNIMDNTEWKNATSSAFCNYNNDINNASLYGCLYNWYAVSDSRNIAPVGWHVPTDDDWKLLEMYLGMTQVQADGVGMRGTTEGGKLKESGTTHWNSPNTGATNSSGFTCLPGVLRYYLGAFNTDLGNNAYLWSSTEQDANNAWGRHLYYNFANSDRGYYYKYGGYSVRCVKD